MGWFGWYIKRKFPFLCPSLSNLTAWNWIGPRRHGCQTIYLLSSQNCRITNIIEKIKLFYNLIYIIFIHILYSFVFPSLKIDYSFGVWNLGENYKNMSIMVILAGNKLLFSALYTLLGLWCWWSYAGIFNIFSYLQVKYLDRTICGDVFIVYRWICVIL